MGCGFADERRSSRRRSGDCRGGWRRSRRSAQGGLTAQDGSGRKTKGDPADRFDQHLAVIDITAHGHLDIERNRNREEHVAVAEGGSVPVAEVEKLQVVLRGGYADEPRADVEKNNVDELLF